jgi:sulfide:quinone oxidoreductase
METRKRVVIAGGGVAALEAALALRQLAPTLVNVELVAAESHFFYRPLSVAEPFGLGQAQSFDLADLAQRIGSFFTLGTVEAVDTGGHAARTAGGATIEYDSLLLACGAVPRAAIQGALTFRGPADTPAVAELVSEVEGGRLRQIAVVVPARSSWALPAYELALMLAAHARRVGAHDCHVALVTPEDEPLLLFGEEARDAIRVLLDEREITLHTGYYATEVRDGELHVLPPRTIDVDRVIALPILVGPQIDGIPQTRDGFVVADGHGRLRGLVDVYAAGDITRFPVKQGGLATQQADAAAEAIAADAGAELDPKPFRPVLRGLLLTGETPRYLRRDVGAGSPGTASVEPLWWPPAKIVGRYLAPFLAELSDVSLDEPTRNTKGVVAVERELQPGDAVHTPLEDAEAADDAAAGTVESVMTTDLLLVAPEDTLGEVAERMRSRDVASALVVDYGRLVGILTSRDLLRAFAGRVHSSEARVREWMTADPITAAPDTPLSAAFWLMQDHAIHHLPVVHGDRPVALAGMRHVARALAARQASRLGLGL